jgi:hypothetical protein
MVTGLDIAQKCTVPKLAMHGLSCHEMTTAASGSDARDSETYGEVLALRAHCVHIAHAEAGILTQEYLSPVCRSCWAKEVPTFLLEVHALHFHPQVSQVSLWLLGRGQHM